MLFYDIKKNYSIISLLINKLLHDFDNLKIGFVLKQYTHTKTNKPVFSLLLVIICI